MKPILRIEKLVKQFGGITAVNQCTFDVTKNSITALIGPNGAGKTTLFDLITGITPPDAGTIHFDDREITHTSTYQRARLGIARTFQAIRIFPELTALENVLLAFPDYLDTFLDIFKNYKKHTVPLKRRALDLLASVNLEDKAHHKAGDLSYGQQKLVEIVRAVATGAELFLFDEPAAGVNRTLLHTITNTIKRLHSEGKTILLVEHDMGFVMELSQHVIVMDYGKVLADGTPAQIQSNPKVLEAYLGQAHLCVKYD